MKRLSECQPDDEDQLIRALVVHLPDGKIERSAEWRMHDRGRYLWALGNGKFMVRQRDSLEITDASLEMHPFLQSSSPLRLVKLSPDGRLLLVETDLEKHTEEEHRRLAEAAGAEGIFGPREDVLLTVLRISDRSVVLRARSLSISDLPIISEGYIETLAAQGDHWMLRYRPFQRRTDGDCQRGLVLPAERNPLNDQTTAVSVCPNQRRRPYPSGDFAPGKNAMDVSLGQPLYLADDSIIGKRPANRVQYAASRASLEYL